MTKPMTKESAILGLLAEQYAEIAALRAEVVRLQVELAARDDPPAMPDKLPATPVPPRERPGG